MSSPLKHIPLFKLLLPFALGIVGASYFPYPVSNTLLGIGAALLASLVFLLVYMRFFQFKAKLQSALIASVSGTLLTAGYLLAVLSIERYTDSFFMNFIDEKSYTTFHVILTDELQEKPKSFKTEARILHILSSDEEVVNASGNLLLYLQKEGNEDLQYGDELLIYTKPTAIEATSNPDAFNYKRYLFHHHIYHQAYITTNRIKHLRVPPEFSVRRFAYSFRKKLLAILKKAGFTGDEFAVAGALLLGQKDHLSSSLARAYAGAGAMHVLAVSGLHVGILYWLASGLFKYSRKTTFWRIFKAGFIVVTVWFYALLTGLSPSVVRAGTMFSAIAIGSAFRQQTNIYNTLAGSAFIILTVEPFMIMQVGMQLSYLAVLGIVYLQPKFATFLHPKGWLFRKAWEITCVSVAAQIATAPLGLLYFHQFPNYFLLSNLVVIPAAFLIVLAGVALLLLYPVPYLHVLPEKILYFTTFSLNKVVGTLNTLPNAISTGIDLSTGQTWGIYTAIACLAAYFAYRKTIWVPATIVCCILLMTYQVYERHLHLNQSIVTFYKVRGEPVFSHIQGLEAKLIAEGEFASDEDQMLFNVSHQMWKRGIEEPAILEPCYVSVDSTYALYAIDTLIVLHQLKSTNSLPKLPKVDWMVVSHEAFVPLEWLKKQVPREIIIDGTWRNYKAKKTEEWLKSQHFLATNLNRTGGIERSLVSKGFTIP